MTGQEMQMAEFASKYETLLLRRERSRLHVTLNRPQVKNALNPTLIGELRTVFQNLRDRRDNKVVILRGAGGTFCAGADLKNMEQSITEKRLGERDPIALNNREYGTFLEMVNTTPQVVVAAVEGYAIAGGFGLLCVSDVAICTEDAGFAMSETAIGIVPAQIAPFVAARIGVPQTRHLALTAARFKGPEALRLGIAHHLVKDSAALDAKLEEILKQIDRCAPLANALTKAVVMKVGSEPLSSVLDFAADRFAEARRSPEAAEGLRAFAEKRQPKWVTE
jgi:isohexenylglutaconyl-CoA hydratase